MSQSPANLDRLHELLADRATQGLGREEREALELMLLDAGDTYRDDLDYAAAAIDVALLDDHADEPLPTNLRVKVEAHAAEWHRRSQGLVFPSKQEIEDRAAKTFTIDQETIREGGRTNWVPWLAAAAAIALAVIAWMPQLTSTPEPTLAQQRDALIDRANDLVRLPWNDAANLGVTGEVIWSNAEQRGYLSFKGLPTNDPQELQYQLWIFDENRPNFPAVDGGVFNALAAGEEVIVPINAKLEVFKPTLFAITTEPPGGVVKHDPELDPDKYKIILTAPVQSG